MSEGISMRTPWRASALHAPVIIARRRLGAPLLHRAVLTHRFGIPHHRVLDDLRGVLGSLGRGLARVLRRFAHFLAGFLGGCARVLRGLTGLLAFLFSLFLVAL